MVSGAIEFKLQDGILRSFVRKLKPLRKPEVKIILYSSSMKSTVVRFLRFLENSFSQLIKAIVVKREVYLHNILIYMKVMRNFISLTMSILSEP